MSSGTNKTAGKVMFIDTVHPELWKRLTKMGFKCSDYTSATQAQILSQISDFQGVVIRSKFTIDQNLLDKARKLEFIARSGSGLENIDLNYAKTKNIICFNSPEGNRDAVAEHCVGMLLTLFNKINIADQEVKKGKWEREQNRGVELKGKTIGLIGYGCMAEAFAQRLAGFNVNVIAYDCNRTNFSSSIVKEVTIEELKTQSDIVSLHVNYTENNYHLVNESFIKSFKKPFYLINTSRGKCVNTRAVIDGIKSKKILGACLDVLEMESSAFQKSTDEQQLKLLNELSSFNEVILTPHVAGWTKESHVKLSTVLADKIQAHYLL